MFSVELPTLLCCCWSSYSASDFYSIASLLELVRSCERKLIRLLLPVLGSRSLACSTSTSGYFSYWSSSRDFLLGVASSADIDPELILSSDWGRDVIVSTCNVETAVLGVCGDCYPPCCGIPGMLWKLSLSEPLWWRSSSSSIETAI